MRYISRIAAGTSLSLLIAACQPQSAPTQATGPVTAPSASNPAAPAAAPVTFQVRDFTLEKTDATYGGATYKGRGTLTARDANLHTGNFVVYLGVKQEQENDEELTLPILMKDGIGTIKTMTYQTSDEEKKAKVRVRYHDWRVIGYVALQPGMIEAEQDAKGAPQG
jgi:hypothetical protein